MSEYTKMIYNTYIIQQLLCLGSFVVTGYCGVEMYGKFLFCDIKEKLLIKRSERGLLCYLLPFVLHMVSHHAKEDFLLVTIECK